MLQVIRFQKKKENIKQRKIFNKKKIKIFSRIRECFLIEMAHRMPIIVYKNRPTPNFISDYTILEAKVLQASRRRIKSQYKRSSERLLLPTLGLTWN